MQFFIAFDIVLAVLSLRSIAILRTRAPWTSAGWGLTFGYAVAAVLEFGDAAMHRPASIVAYAFLFVLTVAFAIAGIRDEPQAEPWWWPTRTGLTRAARRR